MDTVAILLPFSVAVPVRIGETRGAKDAIVVARLVPFKEIAGDDSVPVKLGLARGA